MVYLRRQAELRRSFAKATGVVEDALRERSNTEGPGADVITEAQLVRDFAASDECASVQALLAVTGCRIVVVERPLGEGLGLIYALEPDGFTRSIERMNYKVPDILAKTELTPRKTIAQIEEMVGVAFKLGNKPGDIIARIRRQLDALAYRILPSRL